MTTCVIFVLNAAVFTRRCVWLHAMSTQSIHLPVTIPVARNMKAAQMGADANRMLFVLWNISDGSSVLLMTRGCLRTIWVPACNVKLLNKGGPGWGGGETPPSKLPRDVTNWGRTHALLRPYDKTWSVGVAAIAQECVGRGYYMWGWSRNYSALKLYGGDGVLVFGSLVWKFHEIVVICHNDMYCDAHLLQPIFRPTLSTLMFYYPSGGEIGDHVCF
jgi:hypothetical protein